mgnify:CR=1 FL=1
MRYFISYRHNGADPARLHDLQHAIKNTLDAKGDTFYSTYFRQQEYANKQLKDDASVLRHALHRIVDYDTVLAVVDSAELSTGMLIEFGYCVAIEKPILLFIQKDITAPYSFALANKTIQYTDLNDLQNKLRLL